MLKQVAGLLKMREPRLDDRRLRILPDEPLRIASVFHGKRGEQEQPERLAAAPSHLFLHGDADKAEGGGLRLVSRGRDQDAPDGENRLDVACWPVLVAHAFGAAAAACQQTGCDQHLPAGRSLRHQVAQRSGLPGKADVVPGPDDKPAGAKLLACVEEGRVAGLAAADQKCLRVRHAPCRLGYVPAVLAEHVVLAPAGPERGLDDAQKTICFGRGGESGKDVHAGDAGTKPVLHA